MTAAHDRPINGHDTRRQESSQKEPEEYLFPNSVVRLEPGPVGTLARIRRIDGEDVAGPLPCETIRAIREVAYGRV